MGRDLRDRILARWGTPERVEEVAKTDLNARRDLADLAILEEAPHQLDMELTAAVITTLDADDMGILSRERMRLIAYLEGVETPPSISELARALGRDKKNVSEDVAQLEGLGVVWSVRRGRQKLVGVRRGELMVRVGGEG